MVPGSSSRAKAIERSNPYGPVMTILKPPRKGSAAIQASCGAVTCLAAASAAASIRSRRATGIRLTSNTVIGTRTTFGMATRVTLKAVNDEFAGSTLRPGSRKQRLRGIQGICGRSADVSILGRVEREDGEVRIHVCWPLRRVA